MKKYFEYIDKKSSKFWEITLDEKSVSTCYGKIGAEGQTSKKKLATTDLAKKEYDTLIKEKTQKGYEEKVTSSQKASAKNSKTIKEKTVLSEPSFSVPKLPEDVYESFYLTYSKPNAKPAKQWSIKLWSNILDLYEKEGSKAFQKLETKRYYNAKLNYKEQRRKAEDEYTRQIEAKLKEGYILIEDSRIKAAEEKAKKVAALKKEVPDKKLKSMSGVQLMAHWGSRYHEIDKEKFKEAALKTTLAKHIIPNKEYGIKRSSGFIPESYNDLFEKESEPGVNFWTMFVAKYALVTKPNSLKIKGDIDLKKGKHHYYFFHGDVHITGKLEHNVRLYITGNLTVDGIIRDTEEWTALLVGGDIKAEGMDAGSAVYCGGKISTPAIVIDGTGELMVEQQLSAKLLIENGYDHELDEDKLTVQHHVNFNENADAGLKELEKVLIPEITTKIKKQLEKQGEDFYFDKSLIFDYLKKRKIIWKRS